MIGLIIVNLWAVSPRLEWGWPIYFPVNEHGGYTPGIPLQPFEGGWAYIASCWEDSIYILSWDGRPVPPWPLSPGLGVNINMFSLCLGDINRDGGLDVVYSAQTGAGNWIYVHEIKTGNLLPGWPKRFNNAVYLPSLWDMDGDGFPEVIAVEDSFMGNWRHLTRVHAIDQDGSELPDWPREFQGASYPDQMRPALGDPDRDGNPEVALSAGDSVILLDAGGNIKPGWPFTLGDGLPQHWMERCSFIALADLDGDGIQEIVFSTYIRDTTGGDTNYLFPDTSRLFALSVDASLKPGWPVVFEGGGCPFILSDVDGDGPPEIFVIRAELDEHYRWRYYFLFLGSQGEIKFSFPEPAYRHFMGFRLCGAGDTDGDGMGEIIFSGIKFKPYETSVQGNQALKPSEAGLIALDCFGRETWSIRLSPHLPPDSLYNPYSFWTHAIPSFSDVDGDGFLEISHDLAEEVGEDCYHPEHLWLYTWEFPGITNWRIDWSGPSHDPWNTNNYNFWPRNPPLVRESDSKDNCLALLAIPNPGKGNLTLCLTLHLSLPVVLKAYDPAGRVVFLRDLGNLGPGTRLVEIRLDPGVYFLKAEAGPRNRIVKTVVAR